MAINLSSLSETLSPVSEGSAAQPAAAVACLRHFGEIQPIQCHLSPSFLGSGEGVAYYFTVYVSWSDSLTRPGGYLLWYHLCDHCFSWCIQLHFWEDSARAGSPNHTEAGFFFAFAPPPAPFLSTSANSQWLWHQWFWFSLEQMWGGDSPCLIGVIQEAGSDSTAIFLRCLITLTLSLNC